MQITPAILPESFEHLHELLYKVEGVSHRVQIDICDGRFGLEKTWLPYKETHLPNGFEYEFDVMVNDWQKYTVRAISLGAKRVVVHIDRFDVHDFQAMYDLMQKNSDVAFGVAISNDTPLEVLIESINETERLGYSIFVQVMGIKKIGAQGQPFDERVLHRIEAIRRHTHRVAIQVDGAMNPETIFLVKRSGATSVVVGSYIFGSNNIRKTIDSLHVSFEG